LRRPRCPLRAAPEKRAGLVNINPALSSLPRGLKAHTTADGGELTRNDIVSAVTELTKLGKRGAAEVLAQLPRSAVSQGLAKLNPMAGLREPGGTRHQRLQNAEDKGKALTDVELAITKTAVDHDITR
jgi:hypothetical protein